MFCCCFEDEALFGDATTVNDVQRKRSDTIEILGNDIRRKLTETTAVPAISDILLDDGQIGKTLTAEANQSSKKKVTDTASPI